MPNTWTPPEAAVEHNGVRVYHTYKGTDISGYWYTMDGTDDDIDGESAFDVRDLDAYIESDSEDHQIILRAAIESGELRRTADCEEDS